MMTLLCLIGGAVREIGPGPLLLQVLLIGVLRPQFGLLLKTCLDVEERFAHGTCWDDESFYDDDGSGSGWLSQEGPVWRWRM